MTPFRSEKNTNWEGAYRVPCMVRWPGKIKPGSVSNQIVSHLDWAPTLAAIGGDPDVKEKLLKGYTIGENDLQGPPRRLQPRPLPDRADRARAPASRSSTATMTPRLSALRYDNWKLVFLEQRVEGTLRIWAEPFTSLRVPKIFNLRLDPYERADITSNTYYDWLLDHAFLLVPAQEYVGKFLATFKDYPPRQKAASFNLDECPEQAQGERRALEA